MISLPDPNPDAPIRKDTRQIAVFLIAGGLLEAAVTEHVVAGLLIALFGWLVLLAAHYRR